MWFGILLATFTLYILLYFYNSLRALILAWNVVGPPSVPILGSALYFINKSSEGIEELISGQNRMKKIFPKFSILKIKREYLMIFINILENLEIALRLLKKYGPFTKFWLGPQIVFGIQDTNDVEVNNAFC